MAAETHTTTDAAHATSATTEHSGGGGLPQFKFEYWGGQIVWLLLVFLVLYVLIARVFVPRLRNVLDTRAETISSALDEARGVQAEADTQAEAVKAETEKGRAEARRVASEAKTKAQAELNASQAAEDARLAGELEKAEARIRGMRDKAMGSVQTVAADTAQAIVQKLTGAAVTPAEARAMTAGS